MATNAGLNFYNRVPIGKVNNSFFLDMIEPKLYEIQDGHQRRTSSLMKFLLRN